MRVWMLTLIGLVLPGLVAASETGLRRLDTGVDGRGWEAVGRLELAGRGFCTGAMIAPDLVLTAAHCLFDPATGQRIPIRSIEFRAGFRNGHALAYRGVRRAVIVPDYEFGAPISERRVESDVALLELQHPILNARVLPFATGVRPSAGAPVAVVSYAKDRAGAPSLEELCAVTARPARMLVLDCDVDFGSSGAPVLDVTGEQPRIVSVISAKAELFGDKVALGTALEVPLTQLKEMLAAGHGLDIVPAPRMSRIRVGDAPARVGAKFVKP